MHMDLEGVYVLSVTMGLDSCVKAFVHEIIAHVDIVSTHVNYIRIFYKLWVYIYH